MNLVRSLREDDREIVVLALPALGALIAEPVYVLADTAVVGHLGTPQLGGLAVAASVLLTIGALCIFLAYGTTAAVARLLGAGDEREAAHQAVQGLWLASFVGVAVAAVGAVSAGWLVRAIGASSAAAPYGTTYLRISMLGIPAMLLTFAGTGYLRGQRDTRTPLAVAVATNVFNLALEITLIFGLGYGVGASALATVVAQWIGAAVYITRVVTPARGMGVGLLPHRESLRQLVVVARDLFVRGAALRASFLVGTALAARLGTAEVGAYEIAFEIWTFLALALDAIAIAGQALIATELGAQRPGRARELGDRMLVLGWRFGIACGVVIALTRGLLPHVFSSDPHVVHLTSFLLWIVAAMQPIGALVFVLDGLLIGAGDQRFLARAMVLAAAAMGTASALVVLLDLGLGWVWAALCAFVFSRWLPLHARWQSGGWAAGSERRVAERHR